MTGLFLFTVVGLWIWFVFKVTGWLYRLIPAKAWRSSVTALTFLTLLTLPVIDELIGGFQFRKLCAERTTLKLGVKNPEGRTTVYRSDPLDEIVSGTLIPIRHSHITYHDTVTHEMVAEYDRYVANAGVLVRTLGFSNNPPLTMGTSYCSPERGTAIPKTLKFDVIN